MCYNKLHEGSEEMAWDYKNPTPPQRGDGRYERKFPNNYQVLDCLREHHYDTFGSDLSFNGNANLDYFGCCETHVYVYYNTCKSFANEKSNNRIPMFKVATEKGTVGEQNQYFELAVKKEIFMGEKKRDALMYLKTCIDELAGRNFNLVVADDETLRFIHVPFERTFRGLAEFGCDYTTNEFMRYLRMYYEHIDFSVEYVDPVIRAGLKAHEIEWLDKIIAKKDNNDIEIGPQLNYVNINQKKV